VRLAEYPAGFVQYTNSWEAILQGAKPEYIGLDSNIRGL